MVGLTKQKKIARRLDLCQLSKVSSSRFISQSQIPSVLQAYFTLT